MSYSLQSYSAHGSTTGLSAQDAARRAMIASQVQLAQMEANNSVGPGINPPQRSSIQFIPLIPSQVIKSTPTEAIGAASPNPGAQKGGADEKLEISEEHMDVKEVKTLYTPYKAQCTWYQHPTPLVETSTFNHAKAIIDPDLLHNNVKYNENLSSAQQDAICLAMAAMMKGLALLIGDGTGVGKGRTLAGIMRNHNSFYPESRKYVIVTASSHLQADFRRDLTDIGCKLPLRSLGDNWKSVGEKISMKSGILFVTYKLLARKNSPRSRVDQIIEWLNDDNNGGAGAMLAFDEVHLTKTKTSSTNKEIVKLQESLPHAKVVYASATAMSSVDHLSAMSRLGLWGPGTRYASYKEFENKWKNQTRSGLEIVSAELASQGLYIARRLSLEGAEFDLSICDPTQEQLSLHSRLCDWWTELSHMENVLVGIQGRAKLWGDHLRFFKALFVSFRVEHCVKLTEQEIAKGHSVVISLISTGEAATKRAMDLEDEEEEASGSKGKVEEEGLVALRHTMETIIKYAIDNFLGAAVPDRLYELKDEIETFDLPQSPLDLLIHRLGFIKNEKGQTNRVVELTGRQLAYRMGADGKWLITKRLRKGEDVRDANIRGCKQFQNGDKEIAITSSAVATGISLHNHKKGKDRRRIHIQMELAWAADQAIQTLGRTLRSEQHNPPKYVQFSSSFQAEQRFAQTVAERAERLGAATTGDRRGSGSDRAFGSDLLVGTHASDAMYKMCGALQREVWPKWCQHTQDEETGQPIEDWVDFSRGVKDTLKKIRVNADSKPKQLLGRLLGIEFEASNNCMRIYEAACMEAKLNLASSKADTSDLGVEDVCLGEKSRIIETSQGGLVQIATDIGLSMDEALKKARSDPDTKFSFFTRVDKITKRRLTVLAQEIKAHVRITRPNGRVGIMHFTDFRQMYKNFKHSKDSEPDENADEYETIRKCWNEEYELCLNTCTHGTGCKWGAQCTVGKRHVTTSLIKLPGSLNSLCGYCGPRQIIRLADETDPENPSKCVAVRISNTAILRSKSFEEDLLSEALRKKEDALTMEAAKKNLMERVERQKAKHATASSSAAYESDSDSDSDSGDEEAQYSDEELSIKNKSLLLKRKIEDMSSDEDETAFRPSSSSEPLSPRVKRKQAPIILESDSDDDEEDGESVGSDEDDDSDEMGV